MIQKRTLMTGFLLVTILAGCNTDLREQSTGNIEQISLSEESGEINLVELEPLSSTNITSSVLPESEPPSTSTTVSSLYVEPVASNMVKMEEDIMKLKINEKEFLVTLEKNDTARWFYEEMPLTLVMDDYGGQEKVLELAQTPPSSATEKPERITAGEIYIWSGNRLVIFYETFPNSYGGYIPIGKIVEPRRLKNALGSGSVEINFMKE